MSVCRRAGLEGSLLRAAGTCLSCYHLPPALRGDGPKPPLPDRPLSHRTPLVAASSSAVVPPVLVWIWGSQLGGSSQLLARNSSGSARWLRGAGEPGAGWLQPGERAWVLRLPTRPDVFTVRKHGAWRWAIPCRKIEKRSAARKGDASSLAPRIPAWCAPTRACPQK